MRQRIYNLAYSLYARNSVTFLKLRNSINFNYNYSHWRWVFQA